MQPLNKLFSLYIKRDKIAQLHKTKNRKTKRFMKINSMVSPDAH